MSSTQYILKNNLLADMHYFSESMQQERKVRIVLNGATYNHDKKHYLLDYWEDSMPKSIRALRVKALTVLGFEDSKRVEKLVYREQLFDYIDELKLLSNKNYRPNKELPIDFAKNWVKDKNIAFSGKLISLKDRVMSIENRLFPVIRKLGGNPQSEVGEDTDFIIILGEFSKDKKYERPIASMIELMDLVERELHKDLTEVMDAKFLIFM
jgi:hypothetical protein